ncbi:hypothetical protein V1279_007582 [Bradyrhizobium sp. AZCC 1610]|uniref:hypothetical protein n=1 Tax=Bradyrhizobium sp. AZCC 1610 TaxID=3117020 RepID=UPI002FF2C5EA
MKPARDITIRRCTLHVTRQGGWSWGADAQTLTRRAIERLPALLERRLGELVDTLPDDLEIVQPLCLRAALRGQEWAELIGSGEPGEQMRARLEAAIDAAMTQALPEARMGPARDAVSPAADSPLAHDGEARVTSSVALATARSQPSTLWKLLCQWRAERKLLAQLAAFNEVVLRMWLDRLIEVAPGAASAPSTIDDAVVAELWRDVCALPLLMPSGAARWLARRIIFTLELKTRWAPSSTHSHELLATYCSDDATSLVETPPAAASPAEARGNAETATAADTALTSATASIVAHTDPPADAVFEVDVPCALPFLLLTPLARSGYLATLAAALEAAKAGSFAGGVAIGLARKCLAAPQRGWLREPGALAAAAAFAGRQSCDNELILNAGRALRPQLVLLDACVTDQLLREHRAEAAWLLARGPSGALMLFDEDGLVPTATGSLQLLAMRLAPSGGVLFLPAKAASNEHFDTLDELQIPYATDVNLATRPSAASFIALDGARLWTSIHGSQRGRARALAERGADLCETALANWSAVQDERPAHRPGVDPGFENSLSLAASFALSAIAWTLWRHRSRTTALATIEHFADLDARVRVTPDRVHVRLPMGRRAWDLRDHGLLADVREVPWLGARTVIFGVG